MNVTPEVLDRLRQLANLVSKKGHSQTNVNDHKKEPDQNGNEERKENDTSGSGKTSGNDQLRQRQNNVLQRKKKRNREETVIAERLSARLRNSIVEGNWKSMDPRNLKLFFQKAQFGLQKPTSLSLEERSTFSHSRYIFQQKV